MKIMKINGYNSHPELNKIKHKALMLDLEWCSIAKQESCDLPSKYSFLKCYV
jgi:hypothetical protein